MEILYIFYFCSIFICLYLPGGRWRDLLHCVPGSTPQHVGGLLADALVPQHRGEREKWAWLGWMNGCGHFIGSDLAIAEYKGVLIAEQAKH